MSRNKKPAISADAAEVGSGVLDTAEDEKNKSLFFLRTDRYLPTSRDIYISQSQVRRFNLRKGDFVVGRIRPPKDSEKHRGLLRVEKVNGLELDQMTKRPEFGSLGAKLPTTLMTLNPESEFLSANVIDQISSIRFGQLGLLITSPQNRGTELVKGIANAISERYPNIQVLILVVGGSPTTIADVNSGVDADVVNSKSSDPLIDQIRVAELFIERARRLVESGQEVVVLIDSISKLGQSYHNISQKPLAVELDNLCIVGSFKNGGSLTIVGTLELQNEIPADDPVYQALRNHRDLIEIDFANKKTPYAKSYHRIFTAPYQDLEVSDVFVLMPFKKELRPIYDDHIKAVVERMNLSVKRSDDIFSTGTIMAEIWTFIRDAEIIIADCTERNPNVFYEIGIAHAIEKPVILITQNREDIPFDLQHLRIIEYTFNPRGMRIFERHLEATLRDLLGNYDST